MASDLISRAALLAEYDRVHVGEAGGARKLIAEAPTVDAELVRHGEWIVENRTKFVFDGVSIKCSLCGRYEYKKEPYCHCGAKMDGGKQDAD